MSNIRVEKLEKQVNRQQKLNMLLGVFMIGALGLGFAQPMLEHITVRSIAIVDENGMPRILIGTEPGTASQRAFIQHFDTKGRAKMWQGTEDDISGMRVNSGARARFGDFFWDIFWHFFWSVFGTFFDTFFGQFLDHFLAHFLGHFLGQKVIQKEPFEKLYQKSSRNPK